jgi:hypothetical protein
VLWRHCGNQKQGRHILVSTWTFLSLASLHWRRICWVLAVELVKVWTLSTHAAKATASANVCGLLQAEVCCSSGLIILLCYHLFVCLHNAICRFAQTICLSQSFALYIQYHFADSIMQLGVVLATAKADHRPRNDSLCAPSRPSTG